MDPAAHIAQLRADTSAVLAAAVADPDAPVEACPGWDRRKVIKHLCVPLGWVNAQVAAGPQEERGFRDAERPTEGEDLFEFFAGVADRVVAGLQGMDMEATWPTWAGPRPGAWFARRMAHEVAVHRHDAAGGGFEPAFAADGIDELLEVFVPLIPADRRPAAASTIHLHGTDDGLADGEWLVTIGPDGVTSTKEHAKGDLAVRGTASDLYLWAWNRVPFDDRFETFGDTGLATTWREVLAF